MTLSEIIVSALGRLGRSTDTYTVDTYRDVFATYADAAVMKIARIYKAARKDTIPLTSEGTFLLSELSHNCDRILEVRVNGRKVEFIQDVYGFGEFSLRLPSDLNISGLPIIIDNGTLLEADEGSVSVEFKYPISDLAAKYLNIGTSKMFYNGTPIFVKDYNAKTKKANVNATSVSIPDGGVVTIGYNTVDVIYRFLPNRLISNIDTPEIPEEYHPLIVHYIVACERGGGDPYSQGTSSLDFSLFNEGLRNVRRADKGEPDHFRLKWY